MTKVLLYPVGVVVWLTVFFVTASVTSRLRAERTIICRTKSILDCVAYVVGYTLSIAISWDWRGWWSLIEVVVIGVGIVALDWLMRAGAWYSLRVHWPHKEDCQHGPRRRWGRQVKLRTWEPVALREGFAPS